MKFIALNCPRTARVKQISTGRFALALGLLAACLAPAARSQIVSDDFNEATLNTNLWTWVDPDADDTYAIAGFGTHDAVLSVTMGGSEFHDAWVPNNCPALLQDAPDQDFEVTAKWETIPNVAQGTYYGEYGLLVYDTTGTNFLRFNVQVDPNSFMASYLIAVNNGAGNTLCNGSWQQSASPLVSPADGSDNGTAYMRLKRQGDTWTYMLSADGVNWTTVYGPVTQAWSVAQVGPYFAGEGSQGITYKLDYFFNDASPIVYEDGQAPPPTVSITAPANGIVITLPTNLVVATSPADVAGTITNVSLYEGTNLIASATSDPWSITWVNPSPGQHSVYVVAADSLGLTGLSPTITFQVIVPDTVTITAPANNLVLTNPASVDLTASAADVAGSITNVTYYEVGNSGSLTLIGSAPDSPFGVTWNNPGPGWHTLVAQAADNFGYIATSPVSTVQIFTPNGGPVSDDFNHASLNTNLWTWVDPDGDDTYAVTGFGTPDVVLGVTVTGSQEMDAWETTGQSNNCSQLLQTVVNQDFEVTEKWETIPGLDNGEYGFLVNDPTGTNFLRFDVQGGGGAGALQAYMLIVQNRNGNTLCNGSWNQPTGPVVSPTDGTDNGIAYMRLKRQGVNWTYSLSTDGVTWYTVYQTVQQAWTVATIGPYVGLQQLGSGMTYNLDYFFNDASPIIDEDGQSPVPTVMITAPTNGALIALPASVVITATAIDIDGVITNVDFYDGATLVGAATASPYSITLTNLAPGWHTIIAMAGDSLGLTGSSPAITFEAVGQGGSLAGSVTSAAGKSYDLTTLGTLDWAHWNGTFIDKATGGGLISDVTQIGGGTYGTWMDSSRSITWSDGNPVSGGTNEDVYIWCNGTADSGWTFTVPADTTNRTLHVLVGGPGSGSVVTTAAHLSDTSSVDYSDTETSPGIFMNDYALTYHAASPAQTLTVTVTHVNAGGPSSDLIAAWLTTAATPPPNLSIGESASNIQLSWSTAQSGFTAEVCTNLSNPQWTPVTNGTLQINGASSILTIPVGDAPASFYRLSGSP